MKMKRSFSFLLFFLLVLSFFDFGFSSWVVNSPINVDENVSLNPVGGIIENYKVSGDKEEPTPYAKFVTLEGAVENAKDVIKSGFQVNMYLTIGSEIEVKQQNIELLSGMHLYLPYKDKLIDITSTDQLKDGTLSSSNFADASNSNNRVSYFHFIQSSLTIDSGASVSIGGLTHTVGVVSSYSEIVLDEKSSISVSGELTVLGYIKKDTTKNGFSNENKFKTDNSYDKKRYLEILSGGKLTTFLGVYDMISTGTLFTLNSNEIFPVNKFTFPCLQVYFKVDYGGSFFTIIHLNASGTVISDNACVVSSSSKDDPLFLFSAGYMAFELCSSNCKYTSKSYPLKAMIFGNCSLGSMSFKVQGQNITTSGKFLPISNVLKLFVCKGGSFTINNKLKVLCGSFFRIERGATVSLNSEFICYTYDKTLEALGDQSKLGNGIFVNNGSLVLTKNAKMGAFVETEMTDSSASIDMTNVSESSLVATSGESVDNNQITISSTGLFLNDFGESILGQFVSGQTYHSGPNGKDCWDGQYNVSYTLKVVVEDLYKYNLCGYNVYVSNNSNGSNATQLTSETLIKSKDFEGIGSNQYFKVESSSDAKNTAFTKQPNGANYAFNSSTWFKMSGDFTITITPNEGRLIRFTSQSVSGAGTTSYKLTNESTGKEIKTIKTSGEVIVASGTKFKVGFTGGFNSNFKQVTFDTITKKDLDKGTTTSVSNFDSVFVADGNYEYYVTLKEKDSCFAKGTQILMENGINKNIESLKRGDRIMTWNFFEGKYEPQDIAFVIDHGEEEQIITKLFFENERELSIIADHGLFDYDLNKFVYISSENAKDYMNHNFVFCENGKTKISKLIRVENFVERTHAYSLTSAFNYNAIASGALTAPPPGVFYNWINMGKKMQYDIEKFNEDILKYGLYDYSVFESYGVSYATFVAMNGAYLKIPVEKGIFSFEYIIDLFNTYKYWIQ